MRLVRTLYFIYLVVAFVTIAPEVAYGHGATVHMGLTTEALARLRDVADGKASQPQSVTNDEWNRFILAAKASRSRLEKQAGGADALDQLLAEAATQPDKNLDDIHLYIRPTSALGMGVVNRLADDGFKVGVLAPAATIVVPLVCACDCILSFFHIGKHKCKDCLKDSRNILDKTPEPSDVVGTAGDLIASPFTGLNDKTSDDYTGLPHFLNIRSGVDNSYDDHQGMYYPQAGPTSQPPGYIDWLIMLWGDTSGFTINPSKSRMVANYEINNPDDNANDGDNWSGSYTRTDYQWERYNFAETPMTPVDNLGLYGWRAYQKSHDASGLPNLGYPLHALGDATVPMHVTGTTAWGHRAFEDGHGDLWKRILLVLDHNEEIRAAATYYARITSWRAGHAGDDIPIRLLVRSVAKNTLKYSEEMYKHVPLDGNSPWPFNDGASTEWQFGNRAKASALYSNYPNAVEIGRPLLDDGIAAITAFLAATNDSSADLETKQQDISVRKSTRALDGAKRQPRVAPVELSRRLGTARQTAPDPKDPNNQIAIAAAQFIYGDSSLAAYRTTVDTIIKGSTIGPARPSRVSKQEEEELRRRAAGLKVVLSPRCLDQDNPDVPVLKGIVPIDGVHLRFEPIAIATESCPVFLDVVVQFVKNTGEPTGELQRIVLRSNEGKVGSSSFGSPTPDLTFVIPLKFTGSPSRDALAVAFQSGTGGARRWIWRARAMNANGLFSNWSAPAAGSYLWD